MGEIKGVKFGVTSGAAANAGGDSARVNLAMRAPGGGVSSTLPPAGDPLAAQGTSSALTCGLDWPEKKAIRPIQQVSIDIQDSCQVNTLMRQYDEHSDQLFGVWAEGASVFWDVHVGLEMRGIRSTNEGYLEAFRAAFWQRVAGRRREEKTANWIAYRVDPKPKADLDPKFVREVVPQLVEAMDRINQKYLSAALGQYSFSLKAEPHRRLVAQMAFSPKESSSVADFRDAWDGFVFPATVTPKERAAIDDDLCKLRGDLICGGAEIAAGGIGQRERDREIAIIFGDILRQKAFPPKPLPVEL